MKKGTKYGLGLLVASIFVVAFLLLPVDRWVLLLVERIKEAGAFGVGLYSLAYVLSTLLFLPGSMLTAGAGFAYGPLWGTLLVSPVSVVAATVAFALGRSVARDAISRRAARHPRFLAIDQAIAESGLKIVFLLRLSPIFPFNLLNYALGLTRVRLRDYVLGSFLGMLPGTFLYVYLGSLVTSASELLGGAQRGSEGWSQVLCWGGLVATLAVTIVVAQVARKALHRAIDERRPEDLGSASEAPS